MVDLQRAPSLGRLPLRKTSWPCGGPAHLSRHIHPCLAPLLHLSAKGFKTKSDKRFQLNVSVLLKLHCM